MKNYSGVSHHSSSQSDYEQALYTQYLFNKWGFDSVLLQEIPVLSSRPKKKGKVSIVYPEDAKYECILEEPPIPGDDTSFLPSDPPWNAWSASGNVTGDLVYANYGRWSDYQILDSLGIDLKGKIVIARYGDYPNLGGSVAKFAEIRGASAVVLYTDPSDVRFSSYLFLTPSQWGYLKGSTYLEGPWANNWTTQRGATWVGDGDPQTPGWPSETLPGSPRLSLDETFDEKKAFDGEKLPSIPIQPMGYGDASHLLLALGGTPIPPHLKAGWEGGFNLSFIGPGPVRIWVEIEMEYVKSPIWNVIARLSGDTEPDRSVIFGCHRDAWTFGAGDPISGHSTLLEVARGLSELKLQKNWRPRRSILICSWDAEEQGLMGSIEYVEKHFRSLQQQAVSYVNLDIGVEGSDRFFAAGTPSLQTILREITQQISVPGTPNTVFDMWAHHNHSLNFLGAGSDYVGFVHHAGIASTDFRFVSDPNGPVQYDAVYHSDYDSFTWYDKFGDPDFSMHLTLAKVAGLFLLRLANDLILPFDFLPYAILLNETVDQLKWIAHNQSHFQSLNWTRLDYALQHFLKASKQAATDIQRYQEESERAESPFLELSLQLRGLNDRLMATERSFLVPYDPFEVIGRKWYAHVVVAPSKLDTYSSDAFSGIRDLLKSTNSSSEVEFVIGRVAQIVDAASEVLGDEFQNSF